MDYTEFKLAVKEEIDRRTGHKLNLSIQTLTKNNGTTSDTLCIMSPGINIAPNIHLQPYYSRFLGGMELDDIYDDIERTYKKTRSDSNFDVSLYLDFNNAKHHLVYRLVNFERNKVLLKDIPHIQFLDLAIVFYVLLEQNEYNQASILVRNPHAKQWNQDSESLFSYAMQNTPRLLPVQLEPLCDVLKRMHNFPQIAGDSDFSMYVLSTDSFTFGAATILYPGVLEEAAKLFESDFIIIPSSIHEVLLIPSDTAKNRDYLDEMVREINDFEVADAEVLSDHTYYYSRAKNEVLM